MFCSKSFVKTALIYIFVIFFFTLTYISCSTIGKVSVLNLMYGPEKKKNLSFPFNFVVSSAFFLTHEVPKCGLVVIFQY